MYIKQSFHVEQNVGSESSETPPTIEPQPIDVVSVEYFQKAQVTGLDQLTNENSSMENKLGLVNLGEVLSFGEQIPFCYRDSEFWPRVHNWRTHVIISRVHWPNDT
jgi:hypothetical protein